MNELDAAQDADDIEGERPSRYPGMTELHRGCGGIVRFRSGVGWPCSKCKRLCPINQTITGERMTTHNFPGEVDHGHGPDCGSDGLDWFCDTKTCPHWTKPIPDYVQPGRDAQPANTSILHVPQTEVGIVIGASTRTTLHAHGFRVVDRDGRDLAEPELARFLRALGNNCAQSLAVIDQNPDNT